MNIKTLNIKKTETLQEFCDVWALLYTDSERDQTHYKPAIESTIIDKELLLKFYVWKNGSTLSQLKEKSYLENIESKLQEINNLRNNQTTDFEIIKKIFPKVSDIWLITLAHLINPICFPVFDQHVYRAYKFMTYNIIDMPEYDKEKERVKLYLDKYLPFFYILTSSDTTVKRKKLDEALWGFGKFIGKFNSIIEILKTNTKA